MADLFKVLILFLLCVCNIVIAGYAQLKAPPGWSSGMTAAIPAQVGTFNFGSAANGATFKGNTVLTNAALNVAGQLVTVPVSMRIAVNAASLAATWSFGNPALFVGVLAGSIALNYWKADGIELIDGVWQKKDTDVCTDSVCYGYLYRSLTYPSSSSACSAIASHYNSIVATDYSYSLKSCTVDTSFRAIAVLDYKYKGTQWGQFMYSADRVVIPSSTVSYKPATVRDFEDRILKAPMPTGMPEQLPIEWPVELPVFNPNPAINPQPSPSPNAVPRPLFIPTGDPVPTEQPDVWNQPGVRVKGAPVPDSPWRVDVSPETIPQNSPAPKTQAELNPSTPLTSSPPVPGQPIGLCDQYPGIAACAPASLYEPTNEDVQDFCAKNPAVLACQKLPTDTLQPEPLKTKNVPLSINRDGGWSMGSASCPAPKTVTLSGQSYSFAMTSICDFASGIRPLVVGFAWITAILSFMGLSRKGD